MKSRARAIDWTGTGSPRGHFPPTTRELPCAEIVTGDNDRQTFNQVALEELAASIEEHNLAQPITVRPIWLCENCGRRASVQEDRLRCCPGPTLSGPVYQTVQRYEIVAGERRFRAVSVILQRATILALIRTLDDQTADALMLAENVQRCDLTPIEEANAYRKRMDKYGWSVVEVAQRVSVSDAKVRGRLALLQLAADIQHLIATKEIPISFGVRMSPLDLNRQRIAIAWLRDQSAMPTLRTFGRVVDELHEQQAQESMFDMDTFFTPQVVAAIEDSDTGKLSELLPTLQDLPPLPTRRGGIGRILDDYICTLLENSNVHAAHILMDFWRKLLEANYAHVAPLDSKTLVTLTTRKLPTFYAG